jgi:endo-1,4-beta-D-glucanase Y
MKQIHTSLLVTGAVLVLVSAAIVVTVSYFNSHQRAVPIVFSNNALLLETYKSYKSTKIEPTSGRTIDPSQKDLTTSEGESYTMLRSVWMDDKSTFDSSLKFSQNNLQRPDHLFSWKYGKLASGGYGILTDIGGKNTASDADSDIALSLLMAYSRWNDTKYLDAARPIITSIWQQEVVMVAGKPVLTADNLERNSPSSVVVNPSYFGFANFKTFAKIDPTHDWTGLATNSYTLLNKLSADKLDKASSDGLPPDWITLDRTTGAFMPAASPNLDTNFGYDAMRIPFRLALDYSWTKDGRDYDSLSRYGFLKQFYENTHVLNATYAHDGSVVAGYESPAMYGATIGYFNIADKADAQSVYKSKLQTLYSPDQQSWKAPAPGYYEDNWAWFGLALTQHALPNLTEPKS